MASFADLDLCTTSKRRDPSGSCINICIKSSSDNKPAAEKVPRSRPVTVNKNTSGKNDQQFKRKKPDWISPKEHNRLAKKKDEDAYRSPESRLEHNEAEAMFPISIKSIELVQDVIQLTEEHNTNSLRIYALGEYETVSRTEHFIEMLQRFRSAGKSTLVDVAYHYTDMSNLASIRQNGLLSRTEQESSGTTARKYTGAVYGEGIYTASDFSVFHGTYGDVGIVLARLKGECCAFPQGHQYSCGNNSVSKFYTSGGEMLTVLQSSAQCLPLLYFPAQSVLPFASRHSGSLTLMKLHEALQKGLDRLFNDSTPTPVCFYTKPEELEYVAPQLISVSVDSVAVSVRRGTYSELCKNCAVCRVTLMQCGENGKVARLHVCGHMLHSNCLRGILMSIGPSCPACQKLIAKHQGKMPSGTMTISYSLDNVCISEPGGSIIIRYKIPTGKQKEYHPNPGAQHGKASRIAYLPNSYQGQDLLLRLKFAFLHGLTFTVGTSATTGRANSVIWASILHKTSQNGGIYGFPDHDYFLNCNEALDALNVPSANQL